MERVMPMYRGIARLQKEGDSVQYGGPLLCTDGQCPTADGRAVFSALVPPVQQHPGKFLLTTRRGQQFNSMILGETDPLTGGARHDVFVSPQDAAQLGLSEGQTIRLRSEAGSYPGVCRIAEVAPGTLQAYWPEANVLLPRRIDPGSKQPDYNVPVWVELT